MPRSPSRTFSAHAAIAPGLEPVLVAELGELGVEATAVPGGADFEASADDLFRVHLWSRCAGRVTVAVGRTKASTLDDLARNVRSMPWGEFVHPQQAIEASATVHNSRLKFAETVARKVEHAIRDALRGPRIVGPRPPREAVKVVVRVDQDRILCSVDASGELLHKRGWRLATAKAPLRENLAAAVLRLAGWDPDEPLVDPMCGAGTFPIEAATWAEGLAPGARRKFAFETWPCIDAKSWSAAQEGARKGGTRRPDAPIVAADRVEGAVQATRDNARRAGVDKRIRVVHAPFAELEPPADAGLVLFNPPWGERIEGDMERLYASIGHTFRQRWAGWRVGFLCPSKKLALRVDERATEVVQFPSGGTRIGVWTIQTS